MPTTKTRPLIRNTPTTRAALAFTAGIVAIAASNNANALDTFNYARYPASATVNQSCQGSDVQTSSVKIDNVEVTRFYAGGRLHPGSVVNWVFSTGNANCANDVATIALYATDGDQNFNGTQTIIGTTSQKLSTGQRSLTFTVPKTFCGPYQLDAVVGQPLPRVGHQNAFYDGYLRTGIPTSDYRNMLIDSNVGEMQGQASNGVCREALPMFPDNVQKIDSSFDYVGYPTSQLTVDPKQCATASIADWGSDIGFFVNGAWMGNDVTKLVLKPNDVVMYRFNTSLAACYGQEISLALYRNPNGANGMDTALNQRLVVSNSTTVDNTTKSLTITVPADWDGGWQLDVAFGAPIPVIGDIGRTYSGGSTNMLKTAAKGFIGQ